MSSAGWELAEKAALRRSTSSCLNGVRPHSDGASPSSPFSGRAFEHARAAPSRGIIAA